jgi:hypothetical protein
VASDYEKSEARRMGFDYIWAGVAGQIFGAVMLLAVRDQRSEGPIVTAIVVLMLGTAVLAGGFGKFAIYHGRSRWWGLMSLTSLVGVMFMFALVGVPKTRQSGGFEVMYAPAMQKDVWRMDVRICVEESLGAGKWEPIQMQLPRGASVLSAAKTLAEAVPALGGAIDTAIFRINGKPAKPADDLSEGDELTIAGDAPPTEAVPTQPTV